MKPADDRHSDAAPDRPQNPDAQRSTDSSLVALSEAKRTECIRQILGYLNFSTGNEDDTSFVEAMNHFFAAVAESETTASSECEENEAVWKTGLAQLLGELDAVKQHNKAFRDTTQAAYLLQFALDEFFPAYIEFHQTLLGHQQPNQWLTGFFLARFFRIALRHYSESEQAGDRKELQIHDVRRTLDDYIGYRPVATLESRVIEPYPHEWVRPIPIFISGAGAASGKYRPFVAHAIKMISRAPIEVLLAAQFDPAELNEISIDPRAYDFEHPVNKRPNYHFGQWDPHQINMSGHFHRFIVQQVTLDALAARCELPDMDQGECIFEAGAVLAGTILMASSICGRGPDSFDSNLSIANLLPQIARMRDQFYEWLLSTVSGPHGERLRAEAKEKRQPFGGARQHLNTELANLRETQLETVRLAGIFARMGHSKAAGELADTVSVASARIRTKIECKLTESTQAIQQGQLEDAARDLDSGCSLLRKGIDCGALIDPWNILGFDAQFSLFPAIENSVQDERAHYLVEVMNQTFDLYSELWSRAAAEDLQELCQLVRQRFRDLADWWHQFAAHEVSNVNAADARELFEAGEHVAEAMNLWQKRKESNGNIAFWAEHANLFETPRAYELIVNALFDRDDLPTAMALLMHWLSQAETVGLESAESSFHAIVERWTYRVCSETTEKNRFGNLDATNGCLETVAKFMDFLEVNAESYWQIPEFELGDKKNNASDLIIEDNSPDDIVEAAYENVVYIDSTDDGFQGEIYDPEDGQSDQLDDEARRLDDRLQFHETVARIWQMVSPVFAQCADKFGSDLNESLVQRLAQWADLAQKRVLQLHQLLHSVESLKPNFGVGDHESMVEYDRQRYIQEGILERTINVTVETRLAMRMLNAAFSTATGKPFSDRLESTEVLIGDVLASVYQNDREKLSDQLTLLFVELRKQPLLYVPISRNGSPARIETVKSRQLFIRKLLEILPRFGLIEQTFRLLNVARSMERSHPVGNGAVTEFDDLFETGFRAVVQSLVNSANADDSTADQRQLLFRWLERFTESSLMVWLKHSRTLRLSVLEKVHDRGPWRELVGFIKEYGRDIFTQKFLNFGNIRGILHQGVQTWLELMMEHRPDDHQLLADIGTKITLEKAVGHLGLILEAILENHMEYQDYNSTTTQSDQGDLLYMLIDFLRLKVGYDRISWHLRPVFWAHETLVNLGKEKVAKRWRRSLIDRIHKRASRFVRYLERLQRRYAMRMPSVANRIREKFIKPMSIDRMKALVGPAMESNHRDSETCFEILQFEARQLLRQPEGSGIKVPAWLAAIEDQVAEFLDQTVTDRKMLDLIPQPQTLPRDVVREQLNAIAEMTNRRQSRE